MIRVNKHIKYIETRWEIWDAKEHRKPPIIDLDYFNNIWTYYIKIFKNRTERDALYIAKYNSLKELEEDISGCLIFKHQQWRNGDFKTIYEQLDKEEFLDKINAMIEEYGNAIIADIDICVKTDELPIRLMELYNKITTEEF